MFKWDSSSLSTITKIERSTFEDLSFKRNCVLRRSMDEWVKHTLKKLNRLRKGNLQNWNSKCVGQLVPSLLITKTLTSLSQHFLCSLNFLFSFCHSCFLFSFFLFFSLLFFCVLLCSSTRRKYNNVLYSSVIE